MCKRIITHHMHHDVQRSMVIDPMSPNPTVYASPNQTNYHRCEISQPLRDEWLLNSPPSCEYHSCCLPSVGVMYCEDMECFFEDEDLDDMHDVEPEECEFFTLEHYHERLGYLGDPAAFPADVEATWRDVALLKDPYDKASGMSSFAHDESCRAKWEEVFFLECEKLYTAERDVQTQHAVALDLGADRSPSGRHRAVTANANLLRAEGGLHTQRMVVFDLIQWACDPCPSCEQQAREGWPLLLNKDNAWPTSSPHNTW